MTSLNTLSTFNSGYNPIQDLGRLNAGTLYTERTPSARASIVSLQSGAWKITEQFESLLNQGTNKALLQTPVSLFSAIPFQHLQMNLGISNILPTTHPWGRLGQNLSNQVFLGFPLFQRLLQMIVNNLKMTPMAWANPSTLNKALEVTRPVYTEPQSSTLSSSSPTATDPNLSLSKTLNADLKQQIYTLDGETKERLDAVNSKRIQNGKSPIDFQKTTQEIETIMNNPALSDKDKKKQMGEMRKRLGLSKKEMKKLFTKRLAKIYQEAANRLKAQLSQLKEAALQAEKTYGKNSPQAIEANQKLEAAQRTLGPTLQNLESKAKLYNSMFRSFWSKLGGAFKKIGKGFLKIGKTFAKMMNFITPFLSFIPGIGQMVALGWGALRGIYQAAKGNFMGFFQNAMNLIPGIPGIGTIASSLSSIASKALPIARGIFDAAQGNFTGLLQTGMDWATKIPGVEPFLSTTESYLSRLISPTRETPDPLPEGVPPGAVGFRG
jgi:hypothetical protein